jgi:hypothetical protein
LPRPCLRHDDEHGGAELVAARDRQPPAQTGPRPGIGMHRTIHQAHNRGAASQNHRLVLPPAGRDSIRRFDAACGVAFLPRLILPSRRVGRGSVQFALREN